jgi:hypothetical protein
LQARHLSLAPTCEFDGLPLRRRLTLSLFQEISQQVYKQHSDEVQLFLGIFQQIAPTLNLLERRIQQEKHVTQFKEPRWVKTELNNYTLYRYCTSTAV